MPRKKKTEEEKTVAEEKVVENSIKEEVKDEKKEEEFPNTDIAIDIFSQTEEKKEEKKDERIKERRITKKELEEKAKKLGEKLGEGIKTDDLKEKLEEEREKLKERGKTLIPLEDYIKYGCYIGTKVITPHMKQFVFRRRNDGIAIINTNIIDKRIKEMVELLAKYNTEDWIMVCKREAGWKAVETFSRITGVRIFTKKYPAGILTNPKLPSFFETEMIFICDPWLDKNVLHDAKKIMKPVFALCDTNNYTFGVDFFIPVNNKSGKSLGLILYLLAREYLKAKGIKTEVKIEEFVAEEE